MADVAMSLRMKLKSIVIKTCHSLIVNCDPVEPNSQLLCAILSRALYSL